LTIRIGGRPSDDETAAIVAALTAWYGAPTLAAEQPATRRRVRELDLVPDAYDALRERRRSRA
jgi:hypothetical protein